MGSLKRSYPFSQYLPVFKYYRRGWGLNRGWRRAVGKRFARTNRRPLPRRRRGASYLRRRYRRRGVNGVVKAVYREERTLTPANDGTIKFATYANENNHTHFNGTYNVIYDQYKIQKVYQKFRVERSARVENDQDDVDIIHWSCYDPDASGRTFSGESDFQNSAGSKWHIMKPYQVRTTSLSPVFMGTQHSRTDYGSRRVNNPWLDVSNASAAASQNAVQHFFKGPPHDPMAEPNYKIVVMTTVVILYKGVRTGQSYA